MPNVHDWALAAASTYRAECPDKLSEFVEPAAIDQWLVARVSAAMREEWPGLSGEIIRATAIAAVNGIGRPMQLGDIYPYDCDECYWPSSTPLCQNCADVEPSLPSPLPDI